ncbi:dTDP-4-dehydrorhamnose reductase family protein [Rossellomorea vietnamensis]|uniref:dTDP-4-dehydrorhamnose reductase n=1 Tax=Rossellomorea vietnamensis TaxID=218284 RepID=A0A0P6WMY2_9BACI|nr:SDR family oxidoreductase [Rossellomorea vietnamensis]KPL58836.1 dTDP-4-dehydrorhamnose reductase [Rossellomorea vietnamensis]
MKILVLGGQGMAGHVIVDHMRRCGHEVLYTIRNQDLEGIQLDVRDLERVKIVLLETKPDIVINATGLLNENAATHVMESIQVNSLLPHALIEMLSGFNGKLIHISTDCVFSGEKGKYTEQDIKDGTNIYSKSKSLGEVEADPHLTVRTSIIGPELKKNGIGLLHWFLQQKGRIEGYQNVFWNGVTTLELAKAIESLISHKVSGLYHLSNDQKISKYDLLLLIKETFSHEGVDIEPVSEPVHDKTLVHTRTDFKYPVPSYKEMLIELRDWMRER